MFKPVAVACSVLIAGLLAALPIETQGAPGSGVKSPEPGMTVRNDFGPEVGNRANQCRGACGAGCPKSCSTSVSYECVDSSRLRRVVAYDCGTHQACRVHDDCLDACLYNDVPGGDCQAQCDAAVIEGFGVNAASWLVGGGPYDGRITYEYTRSEANAPEPLYGCPSETSLQCAGSGGCLAADGARVDPAFDSYPAARPGAMMISAFRAGPACGDSVCAHEVDIRVHGEDTCPGGRCTRFGMEFDYRNADPSMPLECSVSTRRDDGDFIGDLLKLGADAHVTRTRDEPEPGPEDGMGQLLGLFAKVVSSADSPEDLQISMAPLDADGNPIESQRVGSDPRDGLPPIPRSVALPAASGHLFVPMYQLVDSSVAGTGKERRIRCSHRGEPVLETTFRLVGD